MTEDVAGTRPADSAASAVARVRTPAISAIGSAAHEALDQIRGDRVGLAGHDRVDERKLPHRLGAHRRLAVRAAHHDDNLGQPRLQFPGQRQRCEMLLEHARETDDARLPIGEAIGALRR